jgi:hypothetical protein
LGGGVSDEYYGGSNSHLGRINVFYQELFGGK